MTYDVIDKTMKKAIVTIIICLSFSPMQSQNIERTGEKIKLVRQYDSNGRESVWITIDSVKQGLCIDYDSLGRRICETSFVDGQWTGPFIIYYPNGDISQKSYVINGVTNGTSINYYHNGQTESIYNFKMGVRDGICEEYLEDGRLNKRYLFRNDTLIRIIEDTHLRPLPPNWVPLEKNQ